jgi:hypothetical protein
VVVNLVRKACWYWVDVKISWDCGASGWFLRMFAKVMGNEKVVGLLELDAKDSCRVNKESISVLEIVFEFLAEI